MAAARPAPRLLSHDEEIGGEEGAKKIAEHFKAAGITFEFMLDEGLFVIDGVVPGHIRPIAMVCVAEKGMANVKLTVEVRRPRGASNPP